MKGVEMPTGLFDGLERLAEQTQRPDFVVRDAVRSSMLVVHSVLLAGHAPTLTARARPRQLAPWDRCGVAARG